MSLALRDTPTDESLALTRALEIIARREAKFSDRLYEIYFEACPEAKPLFGLHSLSEREEMVRESLRMLIAQPEREPWLEENLRALGTSHHEYGVESEMYPPFVDAFVECARELMIPAVDEASLAALRRALNALTESMRRSGELDGTQSVR